MSILQTIGNNVRYHRTRKGLSTRAFSRKTGIHIWVLHRVEHAIGDHHISTIEMMALALGIPLASLFKEPK